MKTEQSTNKDLLSKRVFFNNATLRDEFFSILKSQFCTWSSVGKHFKIYKSKLERIRNGEISVKYSLFQEFMKSFKEKDILYFRQNISLQDRNWGRRKAGISTYEKHKHLFEMGRKIGSTQTKYHFSINTPLTTELSELVGAFIGDGFTNRYKNNYTMQITGDAKLDKEYFFSKLKPIILKLNPSSNPIITKFDNTMRLTVNSKEFHYLLTKRFGLPAGKKTHIVKIPEEIVDSKNPTLIDRCIRGIFDTDGSVFVDKRTSYKQPYIRIALKMKSKNLINQIYSLLIKRGLAPTITQNNEIIQINGIENCTKFARKIGFSNKRHLDKINHLLSC